MRPLQLIVCGLCVALAVSGCASDSQQVKPPKQPDEFKAPPEGEGRYSRPLDYPRSTMDEDAVMKKTKDAAKGAPNPLRGGGMGGPGGGRGF